MYTIISNIINFVFIKFAKVSFFFWLCHRARGILVPQRGLQPVPPAIEAQDHQGSPCKDVFENDFMISLKSKKRHFDPGILTLRIYPKHS